MNRFRFFLEGENFPLPQEGSDEKVAMGWFATRWAEGETLDHALTDVMRQIRHHPQLSAVPRGRGATVTVLEATQISPGQAGPARDSLSFYRMATSGAKQSESECKT